MKAAILSLIFAVFLNFIELNSAQVHIPEGHEIIRDGFLIGTIDKNGTPHQLVEEDRTVKFREDASGKHFLPLSRPEFLREMDKYFLSRLDPAIIIPKGRRIVRNDYIVGVDNLLGKKEQITLKRIGIKVHVTGAPYQYLSKSEYEKLIKDDFRSLTHPLMRPRYAGYTKYV